MAQLRGRVRRAVDFAVLIAVPILLVVGIGDLLGGDAETGVVEIVICLLAALTARNSLSRAKAAAAGKTPDLRAREALLAFVVFAFVGILSVANALRSEGVRAATDSFAAVFLFALAGLMLRVLWRSRSRRS